MQIIQKNELNSKKKVNESQTNDPMPLATNSKKKANASNIKKNELAKDNKLTDHNPKKQTTQLGGSQTLHQSKKVTQDAKITSPPDASKLNDDDRSTR